MSSNSSEFINFNLSKLGYSSKKDIIENLFLKSLVDSYNRIDKNIGIENEIRDRFMRDLYETDSEIKKWLQLKIIYLDWENWVFADDFTLARTDITFKLSGLEFIIECKRLKTDDKAYIDEGLERFISLKYAEGNEFGGMIGFIISSNKSVICNGLNSKIAALKHTSSISSVSVASSFTSVHERKNKSFINMYHFYFDFSLPYIPL